MLDLEGVQEFFWLSLFDEIQIKAIKIHFSVLYNKLGRSPKLPQLDLTLMTKGQHAFSSLAFCVLYMLNTCFFSLSFFSALRNMSHDNHMTCRCGLDHIGQSDCRDGIINSRVSGIIDNQFHDLVPRGIGGNVLGK